MADNLGFLFLYGDAGSLSLPTMCEHFPSLALRNVNWLTISLFPATQITCREISIKATSRPPSQLIHFVDPIFRSRIIHGYFVPSSEQPNATRPLLLHCYHPIPVFIFL